MGESTESFSIEDGGCASEAKTRRVGGPPGARRASECWRTFIIDPWKRKIKGHGGAGKKKRVPTISESEEMEGTGGTKKENADHVPRYPSIVTYSKDYATLRTAAPTQSCNFPKG